jgi:Flp pilus assembly protein TadG
MKVFRLVSQESGATAIEFALTLPIFAFILLALVEGGLLMWTQLGLQNGVEKAARCASINKMLCGSAGDVKAYAAKHAYGVNLPITAFALTNEACGNKVSANFQYKFLSSVFHVPSLTLKAKACFPVNG